MEQGRLKSTFKQLGERRKSPVLQLVTSHLKRFGRCSGQENDNKNIVDMNPCVATASAV